MKNILFLLISFSALFAAKPAISQPSARIAGGPYLQNVTPDGFTVIWTTTTDAAVWVETAPDDGTHFYAAERPKYYDSHLGRRRLGKLHRVRVGGLEPGKTYRYRIMQQAVLSDEGNKRVVLGEGYGSDILKHAPYPVTTPSADRNELEFWMVNDIHGRDSVFRLLIGDAPRQKPDFVCLNGDLLNSIESEKALFEGFLASASELLTPGGHSARRDARATTTDAASSPGTGSTTSPRRPAKVTIRSAAVPSSSSYSTAARTNPTATSAITGFRPPTLTANSRRSGSGA